MTIVLGEVKGSQHQHPWRLEALNLLAAYCQGRQCAAAVVLLEFYYMIYQQQVPGLARQLDLFLVLVLCTLVHEAVECQIEHLSD